MTDNKLNEIQDILTDVDLILRDRLKELGVELSHVLLAITPDGAAVIRSNVGPGDLGDIAAMLAQIAAGAAARVSDNELLN